MHLNLGVSYRPGDVFISLWSSIPCYETPLISVLYQSLRDFSFPLGSDISYSQISPVSVFFPWDWDMSVFCHQIPCAVSNIATRMLLFWPVVPSLRWPRTWYAALGSSFLVCGSLQPSSELNLKVQFVPQRERGPCPLWSPVRKCWMANRSLCVMRTIRNTPYVKIQGLIKLSQLVPLRFKRITTSIIRKDVISASSSSS